MALQWFHAHWHTTAQLSGGIGRDELRIAGIIDARQRRALADCHPTVRIAGHINVTYDHGAIDGRPAWVSAAGHGAGNEHVLIHSAERDWLVVADTPQAVGRAAVRLARELLRMETAVSGGVTVHASCATVADRTVLFLGASGYGKTTLSLAASRRAGFLISGDQTELLPASVGTVAVGFPWVSRLGYGTLAGLGARQIVENVPLLRQQESMIGQRVVEDAKRYGSPTKIELTHLELEVLLGVRTAGAAALDAVVVLALDDQLSVRRADPAEVMPLVHAELREPDPSFPQWWLDTAGRVPAQPRTVADLADRLAGLPLLRVGWHPARHQSAAAIDELAAQIR
jgi:hypothetical protein